MFLDPEVESTFNWDLEWAINNIKDLSYDVYLEAKESWILDFFKETKGDFEEIWWSTAIIQYKNWKWKIFNSANAEWNENFVIESVKAAGRWWDLYIEWFKSTFRWVKWEWENPVEDLKKWLQNPENKIN